MEEHALALGFDLLLGLILILSVRELRRSAKLPTTTIAEETPITAPSAPAEEAESTVDIPVSVVNQLIEQLARLEVLERRDQMRIVRRQERQRSTKW
jgi:hypothetical protein